MKLLSLQTRNFRNLTDRVWKFDAGFQVVRVKTKPASPAFWRQFSPQFMGTQLQPTKGARATAAGTPPNTFMLRSTLR